MIKIILNASDIPSDVIVTKPTGNAQYTLVRKIEFYPFDKNSGERNTIKAKDDCVFLMDRRGNVTTYPPGKMLVWLLTKDRLHEYLHDSEIDDYTKCK